VKNGRKEREEIKGKDMDVSEIHVKISEIKKVIGKII